MIEEMVDVDVRLDKELSGKLSKMTKKDLIERIIIASLEAKVATSELTETKIRLSNEISALNTKLDKAEAYVEQGRAMIESVMNRWYEYDA